MFTYKVEGALDIGSSGIKVALYKNKKIEKINFTKDTNIDEDKIILLQESLEVLDKQMGLKGKKVIVTLPTSKFNIKIFEYNNLTTDEEIDIKINEDLEDMISGYTREEYIVQTETIDENNLYKKILVIFILQEEIERTIEILNNFKIKVLKIIPDFIAVNNLVDILAQKSEVKMEDNIVVVDIGSETSKIFFRKQGVFNGLHTIDIGGNDFTEIIKEYEMLEYKQAELEKQKLDLGDDTKIYETQGEISMHKELTSLLNELVSEVEESIGYFNRKLVEDKITRILLTGGGSLMKGVKSYFDNYFDIPCEAVNIDILEIEYKKREDREILSTFEISTLVGALMKEVM